MLILGQFTCLCGEVVFQWIFALSAKGVALRTPTFVSSVSIIAVSICFAIIRAFLRNLRTKILAAVPIAALGTLTSQLAANTPSPLTFVVQAYLFFIGVLIISLDESFKKDMQKEFWKAIYEYMLTLIQYSLALYVGGIAVLNYVGEGTSSTTAEFIAKIFGPTMVLLLSIFMIAYWCMLPAWQLMLVGYSSKNNTTDN